MRKLKRISDGKVFDCTIYCDALGDVKVLYWEYGAWRRDGVGCFAPAEIGVDY